MSCLARSPSSLALNLSPVFRSLSNSSRRSACSAITQADLFRPRPGLAFRYTLLKPQLVTLVIERGAQAVSSASRYSRRAFHKRLALELFAFSFPRNRWGNWRTAFEAMCLEPALETSSDIHLTILTRSDRVSTRWTALVRTAEGAAVLGGGAGRPELGWSVADVGGSAEE